MCLWYQSTTFKFCIESNIYGFLYDKTFAFVNHCVNHNKLALTNETFIYCWGCHYSQSDQWVGLSLASQVICYKETTKSISSCKNSKNCAVRRLGSIKHNRHKLSFFNDFIRIFFKFAICDVFQNLKLICTGKNNDFVELMNAWNPGTYCSGEPQLEHW